MGAWGTGSFENDDALDFLVILEQGSGLQPVRDALAAVLANEDYVEADEAAFAAAACEVVALVGGRPGGSLPEALVAWRQDHDLPAAPFFAEWQRAVDDLYARLETLVPRSGGQECAFTRLPPAAGGVLWNAPARRPPAECFLPAAARSRRTSRRASSPRCRRPSWPAPGCWDG